MMMIIFSVFLCLCLCENESVSSLSSSSFPFFGHPRHWFLLAIILLSSFLYSNALSLTQSLSMYMMYLLSLSFSRLTSFSPCGCLSIAKQYFVHTAEPLCVSVDDEDGDPTVCVRVFCYNSSIPPWDPLHFKTRIHCNSSFVCVSFLLSFFLFTITIIYYQSEDNNKSHF